MKQIILYKEEKDTLIATFTDGTVVEYEKPRLNVFERYGELVYFNQTGQTILIINNIFNKYKFDYIELKVKPKVKEAKEIKDPNIICTNVGIQAGSELCNYCLMSVGNKCGALKAVKERKQ